MKILKFNNVLELIVFVIMLVLFLVPFKINKNASLIFENIIGKLLIAIIIISLFTKNPLLGLISVLVAFKLFNSYINANGMIDEYIPNIKKKEKIIKKYNNFPNTLEESIVRNFKDYNYNNNLNKDNGLFKATVCPTYNAKKFK